MFDRQQSPTAALLKEWMKQPHLAPNLGRLVEFLARLGREDILTDFKEQIGKCRKISLTKKRVQVNFLLT